MCTRRCRASSTSANHTPWRAAARTRGTAGTGASTASLSLPPPRPPHPSPPAAVMSPSWATVGSFTTRWKAAWRARAVTANGAPLCRAVHVGEQAAWAATRGVKRAQPPPLPRCSGSCRPLVCDCDCDGACDDGVCDDADCDGVDCNGGGLKENPECTSSSESGVSWRLATDGSVHGGAGGQDSLTAPPPVVVPVPPSPHVVACDVWPTAPPLEPSPLGPLPPPDLAAHGAHTRWKT